MNKKKRSGYLLSSIWNKFLYYILCIAILIAPKSTHIRNIKNQLKARFFYFPPLFPAVNLHIGTHKTATTFLQDQLEISLLNHHDICYIKRDDLRRMMKHYSVEDILLPFDKSKKVLLSDENIMGNVSVVMSGKIYPQMNKKISDIIQQIPTDKLTIFFSIRTVSSYLSSAYCEYIRHWDYVSFSEYIDKVTPEEISWFDVFSEVIVNHPDVNFVIFNFENFRENKNKLLQEISFHAVSQFSSQNSVSRSSFTYAELQEISNHEIFDDHLHSKKFDPFSADVV